MNEPSADPQMLEVARALEAVVTWLRDSREPVGVSKSSLSALSRLEVHGPLRITELAQREGLTQPGMTTMVKRLVAAGLAGKTADPDDARAVVVYVAPVGREMLSTYRRTRTDFILARLERLDTDSRRANTAAVPALHQFVVEEK